MDGGNHLSLDIAEQICLDVCYVFHENKELLLIILYLLLENNLHLPNSFPDGSLCLFKSTIMQIFTVIELIRPEC